MEYLIYIAVGIVAYYLGKKFAAKRACSALPKPRKEMKALQKSSSKARKDKVKVREEMILEYAKHKGKVTNDEVEGMFCVSDSTAGRYLNDLEEKGKLKQVGKSGSGVHYIAK
ncbi:MAG: DeoR family transcriptional regulator [Candidatus Marinimicrobia bacterium]|nr:DeoR family transcriptional regulator [Candidatus Neomarinimicrobiota bacterium]